MADFGHRRDPLGGDAGVELDAVDLGGGGLAASAMGLSEAASGGLTLSLVSEQPTSGTNTISNSIRFIGTSPIGGTATASPTNQPVEYARIDDGFPRPSHSISSMQALAQNCRNHSRTAVEK